MQQEKSPITTESPKSNEQFPMLSLEEFKQANSVEERKKMVVKLTTQRDKQKSNLKPVFVYNLPDSKGDPIELNKQKFIVPSNSTLGHFLHKVRSQMVKPLQANNSIVVVHKPTDGKQPNICPITWTIGDIYRMYNDPEDGILYLGMMHETTFGA